jgi:hypothetical protein
MTLRTFETGNIHPLCDFFARRLPVRVPARVARDGSDQFVDRFDHVHRNTNRAGLICNGARDRLPNPPCGVGRKLISAAVFETYRPPSWTDVSFLDEIEKLRVHDWCFFFARSKRRV